MEGPVDNWPDFKKLKVTAALTPTYGSNLVYVLHSDNYYYILYDFANLSKPKKVRSGMATIRSNYLVFTEESAHTMPGLSIKSLINVRAALTYRDKMFLLSRETFCTISLIAQSFEREVNHYFKRVFRHFYAFIQILVPSRKCAAITWLSS